MHFKTSEITHKCVVAVFWFQAPGPEGNILKLKPLHTVDDSTVCWLSSSLVVHSYVSIIANLCGLILLYYKIQMGIVHCIENNNPHSHMLLYVYHQAIMPVNPEVHIWVSQSIVKKH